MTASQYCKSRGIKSLTSLAKYLNVSVRTLQNWYNYNILLFECVVDGSLDKSLTLK